MADARLAWEAEGETRFDGSAIVSWEGLTSSKLPAPSYEGAGKRAMDH